jgi:mannose-6-phosphate isomerase
MSIYSETRPWGAFYVLDEKPGFKVKRIVVNPGGRLSLQSHKHRSEHWTVVEGVATVTVDTNVQNLTRGQSVDVPLGAKHRLENLGATEVAIIEVQFGNYLGEDDIIRYDDVYKRS